MDLLIEPYKKCVPLPFWLRVHFFDTIKKVKETIETQGGIPVHQQTLIFNQQTLPDDLIIHNSDIPEHAHIKLLINTPTAVPPPPSTSFCSPYNRFKKINIFLKTFGVPMEMRINHLVWTLKRIIKRMIKGDVPLSRIAVYANGVELLDHKTLHDCRLVDGSELDIIIKPPTPPPPTDTHQMTRTGDHNARELHVNVVSRTGETLTLKVNPKSKVRALRKELEKVLRDYRGVGEEAYFFIHKQKVMDERQSFRRHGVTERDTIDIVELN